AYNAVTGAQLWVSVYVTNSRAFTNKVVVSPDGSKVFVTGYILEPPYLDDYLTIAYDASTGAQMWLSTYNDPTSGNDAARALAVSPDGSKVFVTGSADSGDGTTDD